MLLLSYYTSHSMLLRDICAIGIASFLTRGNCTHYLMEAKVLMFMVFYARHLIGCKNAISRLSLKGFINIVYASAEIMLYLVSRFYVTLQQQLFNSPGEKKKAKPLNIFKHCQTPKYL